MLFLSAGHSPRAPGASWKGFVEHTEAARWVAELSRRLPSAYVVPSGTLESKVAYINARSPKVALAVEVHFNASPSNSGRGCETLYAPGSRRGALVAEEINNALAEHFFPNRGIKPGWFQQNPSQPALYFLRATKPTAIIIEPEFIYHADSIREKQSACCASLAKILRGYTHDGRIADYP